MDDAGEKAGTWSQTFSIERTWNETGTASANEKYRQKTINAAAENRAREVTNIGEVINR
jgi:hypothetical protein